MDLMKTILTIIVSLFLFVGVSIAGEYQQPELWLLTNPPKMSVAKALPLGKVEFAQAPKERDVVKDNLLIIKECLPLPIWVTINPNDPTKKWYQGEVVDILLNLGKPGDGSVDSCQYIMRLKSDPSITWTSVGFSNSERVRLQEGTK
jgi:hypothetical protein